MQFEANSIEIKGNQLICRIPPVHKSDKTVFNSVIFITDTPLLEMV